MDASTLVTMAHMTINKEQFTSQESRHPVLLRSNSFRPFLTAIRTKSFLLLADISGTGKSCIVLAFAFKSCPKYLHDKTGTTPGNYCMIEVKPNWHDSTEWLGYYR